MYLYLNSSYSLEKLKAAFPGPSGQESGLSDFSALYCKLKE